MTPPEDRQRHVDSAMRELAATDARTVVPSSIEAAVMQAWDIHGLRPPAGEARGGLTRWRSGAAKGWRYAAAYSMIGAAAAIVVITVHERPPGTSSRTSSPSAGAARAAERPPSLQPPDPPGTEAGAPAPRSIRRTASPSPSPSAPGATGTTGSYVLVSDPLTDPSTITVVRVRMSRHALASLGVPIVDPDADRTIEVEMLVGEDGVVRSIRRPSLENAE